MSEEVASAFVERGAFEALWAEKEQWRATAEQLTADLFQAHRLIGRVDYFLETHEAQTPAARTRMATKLRSEIQAGRT